MKRSIACMAGWALPFFPALLSTAMAQPVAIPAQAGAHSANLAHYTSYRTSGPMKIDGKLDEPDWQRAPQSQAFVDIVTGQAAWFDTRVSILWDEKYLYFGFRAKEPDVQAKLTAHDSQIWNDNDLEVFIAGRDAYYEFEINALNTVYDVFWIWQDMYFPGSPYNVPEWNPKDRNVMILDGVGGHVHPRGKRNGFIDWDFPGLLHAVQVNGTLNNHADKDTGWTAEIAFPWEGLKWLADGRPLPPKEGDVWRIDSSRFEHFGPDGKLLDNCAGWTWNRHGYYDSHIPETFTYVSFSRQSVPR